MNPVNWFCKIIRKTLYYHFFSYVISKICSCANTRRKSICITQLFNSPNQFNTIHFRHLLIYEQNIKFIYCKNIKCFSGGAHCSWHNSIFFKQTFKNFKINNRIVYAKYPCIRIFIFFHFKAVFILFFII